MNDKTAAIDEMYWITSRTGGVFGIAAGTRHEVQAECDRLNKTDDSGQTEILAGPLSREEARGEFDRLNAD